MRELSLFSGAGGGLLGTKLLGFQHVGYVEWDDYCQQVIAARIKDGYLDQAPIFGDVRAFVGEWYAASYTGMVDVITAGFPCQPFSVAGKKRGADDERNMWPATAEVIQVVRPQYVFLENVPGLVSSGYVLTVIKDLERLGYTVETPLLLEAGAIGSPQFRERLWILAHAKHGRRHGENLPTRQERQSGAMPAWRDSLPTDSASLRCQRRKLDNGQYSRPEKESPQSDSASHHVAESKHKRLEKRQEQRDKQQATQRDYSRWWSISDQQARLREAHGMDDGLAYWVDRVKATGNGQVSAVVVEAWRYLYGQISN